MIFILNEDNRQKLISKSKSSPKGRERFNKRNKSRVANTVKAMNSIDMNRLFKDDILTVNLPIHGETDDYTIKVTFGGFLEILRDQINKSDNLSFREVSRAAIIGFNKDDVFVHCSCLHPTSKIKLLDGTEPTVEELKRRFDFGEKLYVYSTDEKGDFKPGEVEKVWVTKSNVTQFTKVTLDNGEEILTTPDHLFMLRDGNYVSAEELTVGTSLMPLYFNSINGYETVKINSTGRYNSVYKLVAENFKHDEIEAAKIRSKSDDSIKFKYDVAIHHKDFEKSNNTPENLEPLTSFEHWKYHAELKGTERPVTDRMREVARINAIKRNSNPTSAMIEARNKWQEKGVLRNYDADRKEQQSKLMSVTMKEYYANLSEIERENLSKKLSKRSKDNWRRGCFNTDKFHSTRVAEGKRLFNNPENQKRMLYARPRKVFEYLVANKLEITEENYERYKRKTDPHIRTLFNSFEEAVSYYEINHKVVAVELITLEPTDVYDIKVKDYHNFLVNSSVILHNCPDFQYRFAYYSTRNNYNSGAPETRPSDITNPEDKLGSACKHVLLILNNTSWILRVARVIANYIKYMQEHYPKMYADIIYPAIYGKQYEEPVQLQFDDSDELETDIDTIDKANQAAVDRTRFQRGNTQGVRFASNNRNEDQLEIENPDDEL